MLQEESFTAWCRRQRQQGRPVATPKSTDGEDKDPAYDFAEAAPLIQQAIAALPNDETELWLDKSIGKSAIAEFAQQGLVLTHTRSWWDPDDHFHFQPDKVYYSFAFADAQ